MQIDTEAIIIPQSISPPNELADEVDGEQQNGSKRQKSRHRASVACASCRERRIRVCASQAVVGRSAKFSSALFLKARTSACNVARLEQTVSSRTTMKEESLSRERI